MVTLENARDMRIFTETLFALHRDATAAGNTAAVSFLASYLGGLVPAKVLDARGVGVAAVAAALKPANTAVGTPYECYNAVLDHDAPAAPADVYVAGNTYPHRHRLRELGGAWDRDLKAWIVPASARGEVFDLPGCYELDGKPEPKPEPVKAEPVTLRQSNTLAW